MSQPRYAFAVARIRAKQASLMNASAFERLLACKNAEEAIRLLQEQGFGTEDARDAEELLRAEEEKTWALMASLVQSPAELEMLRYPGDFHNLKAAMKTTALPERMPASYVHSGNLPPEKIREAVSAQNFFALPAYMRTCAKEAWDVLTETQDGQLCDMIVDRGCLEAISAKGRQEENPAMALYADVTVACADIKTALRCAKTRKPPAFVRRALAGCASLSAADLARAAGEGVDSVCAYLSGTRYAGAAEQAKKSASSFERWCDDYLAQQLRGQQYTPFTLGPLVAYLTVKQNEIKSVRLILAAKRNGLPEEAVRERLRKTYG